jgi:hypothetical protein
VRCAKAQSPRTSKPPESVPSLQTPQSSPHSQDFRGHSHPIDNSTIDSPVILRPYHTDTRPLRRRVSSRMANITPPEELSIGSLQFSLHHQAPSPELAHCLVLTLLHNRTTPPVSSLAPSPHSVSSSQSASNSHSQSLFLPKAVLIHVSRVLQSL